MPWKRIGIRGQWREESESKLEDQLDRKVLSMWTMYLHLGSLFCLSPTMVNNYFKVTKIRHWGVEY